MLHHVSWSCVIYASCKCLSQITKGNFRELKSMWSDDKRSCAMEQSQNLCRLIPVAWGTSLIRQTPTTDCCMKTVEWSHDEFQQIHPALVTRVTECIGSHPSIHQVGSCNTLMRRCQAITGCPPAPHLPNLNTHWIQNYSGSLLNLMSLFFWTVGELGPDTRLDKKKDQPHFPCLPSNRLVHCVCQEVLLLSTPNMLNVLQDLYRWLTHSRMSQLLDTSSGLKWKHWWASPPSTSSWSRLSGSQRFCSGLGLE